MRPATALALTLWRGARMGWVACGLFLALLAVANWSIALQRRGPSNPAQWLMAWPLAMCWLQALPAFLLAHQLVTARRQAVSRLTPGAARSTRRVLLGACAATWLVCGAWTLGSAWRHGLPWAPLWSLGTHVLAWSLIVGWMVFRFGGRWGPVLLTCCFLGLSGLRQRHPGAFDVDFDASLPPWLLCALALATLWASWAWALPRVVSRLSDPARHQTGEPTSGCGGGASPVVPPGDLRWIALPAADAQTGAHRERLNLALAPLWLLLLAWAFGRTWAGAMVAWVALLGPTATPWFSGAWVSPRWAWLPGVPSRAQTARALRRRAWRHGLPRAAALAALSSLCIGLAAGAAGEEMLALWCLSMAVTWVSADVALAAAAWRRLGHRGALWPMLGAGGFMAATMAVQHGALGLPLGFGPALWTWAALAWAGALPLSWLLARWSAPAWAGYDWSSMPASPWPVYAR